MSPPSLSGIVASSPPASSPVAASGSGWNAEPSPSLPPHAHALVPITIAKPSTPLQRNTLGSMQLKLRENIVRAHVRTARVGAGVAEVSRRTLYDIHHEITGL